MADTNTRALEVQTRALLGDFEWLLQQHPEHVSAYSDDRIALVNEALASAPDAANSKRTPTTSKDLEDRADAARLALEHLDRLTALALRAVDERDKAEADAARQAEAHEIADLLWRYYLLPLPVAEKARVVAYFAAAAGDTSEDAPQDGETTT